MFETEKHNWRSAVLLCMALVCTIPPDAPALDGVRGSVRTEVETGHTMLGRIVTDRPRWVVDSTIGWHTEDFGRATFNVWTASELSPRYDDERRRYFNEIETFINAVEGREAPLLTSLEKTKETMSLFL